MATSRHLFWGLFVLLLILAAPLSLPAIGTGGAVLTEKEESPGRDEEALRLGRNVLAVRAAIQNPGAPDALQAIVELGSDSRYYVMVRGWLSLQRQGDLSILDASGSEANPEIQARVEFLEKAIRAIDLE